MAKQLKRVEKRYVPQQESYRSLPVPSPTASPVDVVPDVPSVDPTAEKLRQLTEGLSGFNKGLTDYFRMEKSFEETTRVANKVNALLGLPQIGGPGNLDYGKDYGYQEGLGEADGIRWRKELSDLIESNNFFVDEDNPDPTKTMGDLNKFVSDYIGEKTFDKTGNQAYLKGLAPMLAEAKVKSMVDATAKLQEAKFNKQANALATIVQERLSKVAPEDLSTPEKFRGFLNDVAVDSQRLGFDRDAGADLTLETLGKTLESSFYLASDADDLKGMSSSIEMLENLYSAASIRDASGMLLGGIKKNPDGTTKWKLEATVKNLKTLKGSLVTIMDKALVDKQKVFSSSLKAKAIELLLGGTSVSEILTEMEPLVTRDPKSYSEVATFLLQQNQSQSHIVDDVLVKELSIDPTLTLGKLNEIYSKGLLRNQSYNFLAGLIAKREAAEANALYKRNLILRSNNEAAKTTLRNIENHNTALTTTFVGEVTPTELAALQNYSKNRMAPVTTEELDMVLKKHRGYMAELKNAKAEEAEALRQKHQKEAADIQANKNKHEEGYSRYLLETTESLSSEQATRLKEIFKADPNISFEAAKEKLKTLVPEDKTTSSAKIRRAANEWWFYDDLPKSQQTTFEQMIKNGQMDNPGPLIERFQKAYDKRQIALLNLKKRPIVSAETSVRMEQDINFTFTLESPFASAEEKRNAIKAQSFKGQLKQ